MKKKNASQERSQSNEPQTHRQLQIHIDTLTDTHTHADTQSLMSPGYEIKFHNEKEIVKLFPPFITSRVDTDFYSMSTLTMKSFP